MQSPDVSTLGEVLTWQARHRPDKRAFLFLERGERETESLTFSQLHLRALAIAHALQTNELGDRRVLLAYPPGLEYVAALFGCFYAGAIAVPVPVASYGNSVARIRAIWSDAQAAGVLSVRFAHRRGRRTAQSGRGPAASRCALHCDRRDSCFRRNCKYRRPLAAARRTQQPRVPTIHLRLHGPPAWGYAHSLEPDP